MKPICVGRKRKKNDGKKRSGLKPKKRVGKRNAAKLKRSRGPGGQFELVCLQEFFCW